MTNQKEKYLEDIKTIKDSIIKAETSYYLPYKAGYAWAVLILAGTLIQQYLIPANIPLKELFFILWTPLFLIAISFESLIWYRNLNKDSLPVFSNYTIRLLSAFCGMSIFFLLILLFLLDQSLEEYIPLFLLFFTSLWAWLLVIICDYIYVLPSAALSIICMIIYFLKVHYLFTGLAAGISISFLFALFGVFESIRQQNRK